MGKAKQLNFTELISDYDENFLSSISLKEVKTSKELKELLQKLCKASYVVTSFYEMLYSDYMTMINNDVTQQRIDFSTVKRYKSLASKIQKAYNYVLYLTTFEDPFKLGCKK